MEENNILNQIQNQNTVISKSSQHMNYYKYGFFLMIFALVSLVTFVFFQQKNDQNNAQNKEEAIVTTVPFSNDGQTRVSPTTDPYSNWKTYSNEIFSFRYPPTWDTHIVGQLPSHALMVAPQEKIDDVKKIQGGFGGGKFLTFTIDYRDAPPDIKTNEYQTVTTESIVVGGVTGTKYNVDIIQDSPGVEKGDKVITIIVKVNNVYINADLLDMNYLNEFNQIISTFKFQ